ncbi:MAG: helix-turn-helix domain-containing protein [Lachnospiraceae bacterium]|nr:helix-turn-helix domain-containing protein [Lachnospiraceae bacterium]
MWIVRIRSSAKEIISYTVTKINKNEQIFLELLMRICKMFQCNIRDICEIVLDEKTECKITR